MELADVRHSKCLGLYRVGSSPTFGTNDIENKAPNVLSIEIEIHRVLYFYA